MQCARQEKKNFDLRYLEIRRNIWCKYFAQRCSFKNADVSKSFQPCEPATNIFEKIKCRATPLLNMKATTLSAQSLEQGPQFCLFPLHTYTPYSTNVHNSAYYNRVNSSCFLMILTYFKSTVARRCSIKKLFKNFPKFTGKHLCRSLFLIKLQGSGHQLYLKRDSDTDVFPVNFTRFSRAFAAKLWK